MTLLYLDPIVEEHQTGPGHPERPARAAAAAKRLADKGLVERCKRQSLVSIDDQRLGRLHSEGMLRRAEVVASRGGHLEADTPVCPRSVEIARLVAGAAVDAVTRVAKGEDSTAFCLIRPPGHHATPTRSMGFCLYNNVALAAKEAIENLELDRVLIVDWDVHHGNGTQDIFYDEPRVTFFSAHRYPFYPGTGAASETGTGKGLGHTFNLPVAYPTTREKYRDHFRLTLEKAASHARPQLVLISAGFDAHRDDPIGCLDLETEDFELLTRMVLDVADVHAAGRVVSLLEGGYDLDALAEGVEVHVRGLLDHAKAAS